MTFGEHLEELRQCLVKAVLWLAVGLIAGLFFADRVILFVQQPLSQAIQQFNADRDLHQLGYTDPTADEVQPLRRFLMENSLIWQVIYEIPDEYQSLTMDSISAGVAIDDQETPTQSDSDQAGGEPTATAGEATSKAGDAAKPADEPTETSDGAASGPAVGSESQKGDDAATPATAPATPASLALAEPTIKPVEMAELLSALPDPGSLQPKVQLIQNKVGVSSLKMEEPFMIWVKAGLIVGAIFVSPMIFYHIWSFVAAGLHAHERKYVYIYMPLSVALFVSGVVLAFFMVLHYVLTFLLAFNGSMDVAIEPRLTYYVNFVLLLPLGFGIAFQLPLVMLFLQRIGLFETQAYVESWKVAILVIFIVSMLLTPADVTSMVALAVPLIVLYILGILMCKFIPRGRGMGSGAYDPA